MDFEKDLAEFAENDLKELLDSDYYVEALRAAGELDLNSLIEGSYPCGSPGVVLNDRLITEASMGLISHLGSLTPLSNFFPSGTKAPPSSVPIKNEHSYSLSGDTSEASSLLRNFDDDLSDLENECYPAISITEAEGSRPSYKSPFFMSMNPSTRSDQTVDKEPNAFPSEPSNLQRHLSTETLSCCGDCNCHPEEDVLDFNNSLPSSPFPLIRLHDDDDDVIAIPDDDTQQQQKQQQQQFMSNASSTVSTGQAPSLAPSKTNHVALITVSNACSKIAENTENSVNKFNKKNTVIITHNNNNNNNNSNTQRTSHVHNGAHDTTATYMKEKGCEKNSVVVVRQDTNNTTKDTGFLYPPTPPSCSGSDSESGGYSPTRSNPLYEMINPPLLNLKKTGPVRTSSRNPIHTHLISSQPKGATGTLYLTEEEKRTLLSEGYAIPSKLPLTKAEEKSLKKVRRKIKNKISAQESRRKKKEYMDTLEHKVDILTQENNAFRRKLDSLQHKNSQLLQELEKLQSVVQKEERNTKRSTQKAMILS